MEIDETPGKALIRELMEELGVAINDAAIRPFAFAESEPRNGSPGLVILLYTVARWRGQAQALEAGAELAWCTLDDMKQLPMPPLDVILSQRLSAGFSGVAGP